MKWINFHHLIYFREVVKAGSVTIAAQNLKIAQPALSQQIRKLEDHLGSKLFEKVGKKLIPTKFGENVFRYADEIFSLGQQIMELESQNPVGMHLNIGVSDTIPKTFITDFFSKIHEKYQITASIFEGNLHDLVFKLINVKFDFILTDTEITEFQSRSLFSYKLLDESLGVFGGAIFKQKKNNFPDMLNKFPLILPTKESKIRNDLDRYFDDHNIRPSIIAETQDSMVQKLLALKDKGIIFVPDFSVMEFLKSKKIFKLGHIEEIRSCIYLVSTTEKKKSHMIDLMLNLS